MPNHPDRAETAPSDTVRQDDGESPPEDVEERLATLERRQTAVEAELESIRGLLGGVDAIDRSVDRRASIALAKVEALEASIGRDATVPDGDDARTDAIDGLATDPDALADREFTPAASDPGADADERDRASLASRLCGAFR
ncbi:MAG: hypothetical protein ABEK02_05870 [Haloquadratum sp.]